MGHNRIFERPRFGHTGMRAAFRDVTKCAYEWGLPFELYLQPHLLHYLPPDLCDDEDGFFLVGHIVAGLNEALSGRARRSVSYGTTVGLEFTLSAHHRRRGRAEVLRLLALLGPCHAKRLSVFVLLLNPRKVR